MKLPRRTQTLLIAWIRAQVVAATVNIIVNFGVNIGLSHASPEQTVIEVTARTFEGFEALSPFSTPNLSAQ